jgi:BirA family transcriptional regulator, biotin operon repressor / biotin---[acetyl-CoA-carboxylase] ligase
MIQIQTVAETGSTNADMLALAAEGAPEGLWLRAERQSGGKGRMGREWASPVGNLYASGLIRLRPTDPPAPTLAFVAAVALVQHLRSQAPNIPYQIKWPNDVMVDGAKLSGILLERAGEAVVVGIGVNLASHPDVPDRRTISLFALSDQAHNPRAFMEGLARAFEQAVSLWRDEGMGAILSQWESHAHPLGTALTVTLPDGAKVDGRFDGLSTDAALRLKLADGTIQRIHAGDVFLV